MAETSEVLFCFDICAAAAKGRRARRNKQQCRLLMSSDMVLSKMRVRWRRASTQRETGRMRNEDSGCFFPPYKRGEADVFGERERERNVRIISRSLPANPLCDGAVQLSSSCRRRRTHQNPGICLATSFGRISSSQKSINPITPPRE